MNDPKPLFTCHGWTVSGPNADGNYDVYDEVGDPVDEATTQQDAIDACREQATDAYRERLLSDISDVVVSGDVTVRLLERIALMLGVAVEEE